MGHNLAVIGALYSISKYGDYSSLVRLFEKSPMLVIKDEHACQYILKLIKESPKVKRPKTLKTVDKRRELDFFVARVFAYHFLGAQLYNTEEDKENAEKANSVISAVYRVYCWGKLRGSDIGYDKLKKQVRKEGKKGKHWISIHLQMSELYHEEKGTLDLLKGKRNARGTYFDPIERPEFWEELERGT